MNQKNEHCIDICNKLLRGELSALETYEQALEKVEQEPQRMQLADIRNNHVQSVKALKENIRRMGGTPDSDSGLWGDFAQAVEGTAKVFGNSAAISALKSGEEHGKSDYESALEDDEVMNECKTLIRTELLPRQNAHIATLEAIQ